MKRGLRSAFLLPVFNVAPNINLTLVSLNFKSQQHVLFQQLSSGPVIVLASRMPHVHRMHSESSLVLFLPGRCRSCRDITFCCKNDGRRAQLGIAGLFLFKNTATGTPGCPGQLAMPPVGVATDFVRESATSRNMAEILVQGKVDRSKPATNITAQVSTGSL